MSGWRDVDALAHAKMRRHPVDACRNPHPLARLPGGRQLVDFRRRHAESGKSLQRRFLEFAVTLCPCRQILALGVHQRRRVDLEQRLALRHRIAGGLHAQGADPTFNPSVNVLHGVLVVLNVAHGLDAPLQHAAFGDGNADAEVLHHRWVDDHDILVFGWRRVRVDRHQIHAHRRFARFVAAIVLVHGRDPIQHFARCLSGGRGLRWDQPIGRAEAGREGKRDKGGRQRQAAHSVHSSKPPR